MFTSSDVSVIIPVYHPVHYLPSALESVLAEDPGEVIVVNDAAPEPLPPLPADPRLRILCHPERRGPGAARNTGVRAATKPWLAFNDADDLWVKGRLMLQLDLAQKHRADVVQGACRYMGADGGADPQGRDKQIVASLSSLLLPRALLLKYPIDEVNFYGEDLDFFVRLKDDGLPIFRHEEAVFFYRQHALGLMGQGGKGQQKRDMARVLAQSAARRRAQQQKLKESSAR